jgi:hypothetical protein
MNPLVIFTGPTSKGGREFEFCFEFVLVLKGILKIEHFRYFLENFRTRKASKN